MNMQIEMIKRVLVSQREELDKMLGGGDIIERRTPEILAYLAHPNILVITGPRRCGKSVLANLLLGGKEYGYANFDDERLMEIGARELDTVLEAMYGLHGPELEFIVLDEIQNVLGWELFASRLRRTKKVIITGSNARLLSGELATHITGRYMDFNLFPFSFLEFLACRGLKISKESLYSTKEISQIKKQLESYIDMGGFPEVQKFGKPILGRIYDDIILKDAILRYGIRYRTTFRELARYLLANAGHEITFSRLGKHLSIKDVHTVKNYVDFLCSVYLVFLVERYSRKLKQRTIAPKKVYSIDTGLSGAVAPSEPEAIGRTMENIVGVELLRRNAFSDRPYEVFYWKDHRQREVDFVIVERGDVKTLLQVCHHFENQDTRKRELDNLVRASAELDCSELLLISWEDEEDMIHAGARIRQVPLWKWLLTA
jgi:predicted AAA+ superfamily ATPase